MARLGPHLIPTSPPGCVIESCLRRAPGLWEWNAQSLEAVSNPNDVLRAGYNASSRFDCLSDT